MLPTCATVHVPKTVISNIVCGAFKKLSTQASEMMMVNSCDYRIIVSWKWVTTTEYYELILQLLSAHVTDS